MNLKNTLSAHRSIFFMALFFTLWQMTSPARSAPVAKISLTEEDKKEIVAILFRKEFGAVQKGNEVIVFLSPRSNSNWIPEIPGVRFKQLRYEEEQQVAEYYEVGGFQTHRSHIEVDMKKGNYCKMVGTRYQFRKENGKWQALTYRGLESYMATGGNCAGCAANSGALYKINAGTPKPTPPKALLLKGEVLTVRCSRDETKSNLCEVDLNLDFFNNSTNPMIILQPFGEYQFWHGATSLALSKADAEAYSDVYSMSAWPSIYNTLEYRQLGEALDQPTPPASLTRIIRPNESWQYQTTIRFHLAEENRCSGSTGVEIGWRAARNLTAPLWLRISYEMWPFNVENFKRGLGGKLRKRWKSYGELYLEEKSSGFWFARLTSEPIELDLRNLPLK